MMGGKQGANVLNHVAILAGQDQFYFFPLLLDNGYYVFSYRGDTKGPISRNSWGVECKYMISSFLIGIMATCGGCTVYYFKVNAYCYGKAYVILDRRANSVIPSGIECPTCQRPCVFCSL